MQYTSAERAEHFVRRGLADMIGGKLMFHNLTQCEREEEYYRARLRAGMTFWNGERGYLGMRRPGEVRS